MLKHLSILGLLLAIQGCDASSETTCENPNSNDPVCTLDKSRLVSSEGVSGEDATAQCTTAKEGLVSYDAASGGFTVCTGGKSQPITIEGEPGPAGPQGPQGSAGGLAAESNSSLLAPGASLTLTHNLNSETPSVFAYFARGGVLRPVSDYKSSVGRKTVEITGGSWGTNLRPQIFTFADGRLGILHENTPESGVTNTVLDIWSDEGDAIKLGARTFAAMANVRAIATSNGALLVYESVGGTDEMFTVIGSDGSVVVAPVVIGPTPGTNRIKDVKLLGNGNVLVSEQSGGNAAFHILDPVAGSVVASNLAVATASDFRVVSAPLDNRFHIFFTDSSLNPNARAATFLNDGSPVWGPGAVGLANETTFGAERVSSNRIVVVTSFLGNLGSTVFDSSLNIVRSTLIYSPLSADGSSPVALGNGQFVVCSSRSEGYCVTYDGEGSELFRNGDLFKSDTSGDFASITALGSSGRFAIATRNSAQNSGYLNILQGAPGQLDLEVVDANTVRVVNRTVETLPVVLTVIK